MQKVKKVLTMSITENILEVKDLTKVYGKEFSIAGKTFGSKVIGANNVSFSIKKGEIFGFLGPNGAGKTTVMRSILDFLKIKSGSATIFGLDHHIDRLKIRNKIAYVPGDMSLFSSFTGEEIISYLSNLRPINEEFLKVLRSNFRVKLHKKIKTLSKGNRQMVGLIAAMASKPDLLILDEPTSGLDPLMTANFHNLLRQLQKEDITIFLSSHDLTEVQAICDRVGIIKEGKMILVESVENLKTKFLQKINVSFSDENYPTLDDIRSLPNVIAVQQEHNTSFSIKVGEKITEVIRWLSKYDFKRFTCEDATLEEIFLQFYK